MQRLRREALEFHGDQYDIPYSGDDATGLGKPLKLLVRPLRESIPIYLAALSPKNVRTAFEIADGWLPIYFSPERARDAFAYEPREGFDIAPSVNVIVSDDLDAARDMMRPLLALYIGGMGARGANFYNALFRRYGYEAEAERIQELYLDGKQREAIAAVSDDADRRRLARRSPRAYPRPARRLARVGSDDAARCHSRRHVP